MTQQKDYVLVKDKKGELKYYKDGKFFDLSQIKEKKEALRSASSAVLPSVKGEFQEKIMDPKIEQKINDIIAELKISFADSQIEKRFRLLLASRLKGLRSESELKYMMTVEKKSGGLGLDEQKAQVILAVINKHQNPKTEPQKITVEKIKTEPVPLESPKKLIQEDSTASKNILRPEITEPVIPLPQEQTPQFVASKKEPLIKSNFSPEQQKQQIADVKYRSQAIGPVEELQTLDLENFRRLGDDAQKIIKEVEEKIERLKNENFLKGEKGIVAWQSSPVYQIYTKMGVDCVLQNKSLKDLIVNRQIKNEPSLSESEFLAILELNKKLS